MYREPDAYNALVGELERLRRRIFLAKAERVDAHQLELRSGGYTGEVHIHDNGGTGTCN
ncbi:hypothetical protein LVJ94_06985 [Pendulispora rubella]|uniref:Uncharacterized protein n=1 Tax=Pendulispora rubella TaxID=2741070 RepID=A0ABZ2L7W6_9BACT